MSREDKGSLIIFITMLFLGIFSILLILLNANLDDKIKDIQSEYNNTQDELSLAMEALNDSYVANYELRELNDRLLEENEDLREDILFLRIELGKVQKEYEEYIKEQEYKKDISLDLEYQKYIYNRCVELDLDYDLSLAKISLESNFDINARGYNRDSQGNVKSTDIGLMQVNDGNVEWANELVERELDIYNNVYDNIDAGLAIYKHYKSYWVSRGYVDRELDFRSLNSYNRGISGFKRYMENGNNYDDWIYGKLVMDRLEDVKGE